MLTPARIRDRVPPARRKSPREKASRGVDIEDIEVRRDVAGI